jgi:hypothetical protein
MADIGASNWSETDASNSTAAPDGFPEGMAPSGVNNGARAVMGAIKRFWNRANAVKTTAGTTSAYTLTFDVAPGAYVNGEIISFVVNATNAAAATLNVNALGAIPLRLFAGNLLAGALIADQIVQARYNSSAGAFDIIPQNGWVRIGSASPSGATEVDFTGIPAAVNNLMFLSEFDTSADGESLGLRTYDAAGNLDSGATDYAWWGNVILSANGSTPTVSADTSADSMAIAGNVDNGVTGIGVTGIAQNIQAATYTKFTFDANYLDSSGTNGARVSGAGQRLEADRITGIRLFMSSGTITGRVTLFASA